MINIGLQQFGEININQLEDYYSTKAEFNGQTISLDLNFENKSINLEQVENIKIFLDSISVFDKQNKTYINKDFKDEGEAFDYINFYFDELDEEEISEIINFENQEMTKEEQLLSKLRLIRVGLYPDYANYYGVFDYSIDIDGEPCNQLLVVKTDNKGGLDHITWES
jgi:hypothetical protein